MRRVLPDGDVGTLSQSASGALQASVDLSHLYRPFKAHHLHQLVTEVWMERDTINQPCSEAFFFIRCGEYSSCPG